MKSKNWVVDVACKLDESVPECNNSYDLPCDRNPFRSRIRESVAALGKIVTKQNYDAIICNTLTGSIVARLAKRKLGEKFPKLFYINHGLHFFEGAPMSRWIMGYPLEKILVRFTDVLVTINGADFQMAQRYLKPKKIERLYGIGVDLRRFRECILDREEQNQIRHSLGIYDNDFVLTYVAEINENKNQAMLLEVFNLVDQAIPNAKMLLIGPEHDEGKLRQFSERCGLSGKVKFLGWRDDIPQLLCISDVYVASSKSEGLGLNLIEAMACNLPVVASKNRGHAEIVCHGETGFLVDLDDVEEMAKYVMELYHNEEMRRTIVAHAQENIEKFEITSVLKEEERIIVSNL